MLFEETHLAYILLPVIVVLIGAVHLLRSRIPGNASDIEKAVANFKIMTMASAVFLFVLYFLLPPTAVLTTFGYPESLREIERDQQLLRYLQQYNHAIARTADVVKWFLFTFVWWFLASARALAKAIEGALVKDPSGPPSQE